MRKIAITMAISAAILCLGAFNWSANATVGSATGLPHLNYTPKHEAACRGFGPFCGPGFTRVCGRWRCWCRPCW